ncbi:response regulator [Phaeospirillum tilakii]|uniref:Response regulator n=1 Tax=Phaeospirillum tilakii TaxID=741673 RepID=A0ABW5C4A3_9PROT
MNPPTPYRVLVVDDDAGDIALVSEAIGIGPYPCVVEHARDGIEALARLRPASPPHESPAPIAPMPHLVLLDINMPRMNGFELLGEIRADPRLSHLPVVMMSTSTASSDVASAYRAGAGGYFAKPFDIDALFHAIHRVEDYWFGLVRPPG